PTTAHRHAHGRLGTTMFPTVTGGILLSAGKVCAAYGGKITWRSAGGDDDVLRSHGRHPALGGKGWPGGTEPFGEGLATRGCQRPQESPWSASLSSSSPSSRSARSSPPRRSSRPS